jgi:hypothetical protein
MADYWLPPANGNNESDLQSSIINNQSLQAYSLNGAGVNAGPAIDASIRVNGGLAINHADCVTRTFPDA